MGIVSSIGNTCEEVTQSLRAAKSGIVAAPDYERLGFRSEGVFHSARWHRGRWHDLAWYGVLADEWASRARTT